MTNDHEDRMTRVEVYCLVALLYLSMFWRWITSTSPWEKNKTEERLFWGALIVMIPLGYLMASGLCWIGADCTIASSYLANWLFGK